MQVYHPTCDLFRNMMTSSNGNIFRVTGHLCGELTGHRWIPRTKASDAGLYVFFDLHPNKRLSKQPWGWWFETPSRPLWRHCNDYSFSGFYRNLISIQRKYDPYTCIWFHTDGWTTKYQSDIANTCITGIILGMGSANEKRRCDIALSLISRTHIHKSWVKLCFGGEKYLSQLCQLLN